MTAFRNRAWLVAVGGGKGGVGKSVVACNLAVALAQTGRKVVLVDADLGGANQHTLFGITQPGAGLQGFLDHEAAGLGDVLVPTMVSGLSLLPGSGAVLGAANINHSQKQRLLRNVRGLDADLVVVDVGAGVSFNVLDFFDLGTFKVTVMTPQLTSIQNAYGFLKGAVLRALKRLAAETNETALVERAIGRKETDPVREVLARLESEAPALAASLRETLRTFGARIIGNQVTGPKEVGVFHAVSRMIEDFLGVSAPPIALLSHSSWVHDSVNQRKPILVAAPKHDVSVAFQGIAARLVDEAGRLTSAPPLVDDDERAHAPPKPDGDLPSDLGSYMRRHPRHAVAWTATLEGPGQKLRVTVEDVSLGGASLAVTDAALAAGDRLMLTIDVLPGRPRLAIEVRNVREGHVGVAFMLAGPSAAELVAAAIATAPTDEVVLPQLRRALPSR